ncbi:MAG: hypothetical protein DME25_07945 [Verrucomicrobia bacterium]|nr:MAG: hypothetical protein DME25_07945 [Verrucomicrobiota bacterium]
MRIEPQARSLLGMLSQVDLISVAVVKAWGKRVASLQIQKMGQHLDHPPRRRLRRPGRSEPPRQLQPD